MEMSLINAQTIALDTDIKEVANRMESPLSVALDALEVRTLPVRLWGTFMVLRREITLNVPTVPEPAPNIEPVR